MARKDPIKTLVDDSLRRGQTDTFDTERCPVCNTDWHGLPKSRDGYTNACPSPFATKAAIAEYHRKLTQPTPQNPYHLSVLALISDYINAWTGRDRTHSQEPGC